MTLQSLPYRFLMYCLQEYEFILSRVVQMLRKYKRLRQHPRNTGPGWLALDHFTADGAPRASSARNTRRRYRPPQSGLAPGAAFSSITSCLIPYGARPGASPSRRDERLLLEQHGSGPHSTHSPPPHGSPARRRPAARPESGGRGEQGRGQQDCLVGTTPAPGGETARASIGAWQSSPPFRFRAPCPASPS